MSWRQPAGRFFLSCRARADTWGWGFWNYFGGERWVNAEGWIMLEYVGYQYDINVDWSWLINHDQPCKSFQSFPQSARSAGHSEAQEILLSNPAMFDGRTGRCRGNRPGTETRRCSWPCKLPKAFSVLQYATHTHIYISHIIYNYIFILIPMTGIRSDSEQELWFWSTWCCCWCEVGIHRGHTQRTRSICWFCFISQCCELKALAIFGTWS